MSANDKADIQDCLDGKTESFGRLVQRYETVMLSLLTGRLGSRQLAEDAAQETFVRAFVSLPKLDKHESFLSWLIGIAIRTAKEQTAKEIKIRRAEQKWSHDYVSRGNEKENFQLERAVGELPEPYRQLLLLRYYGNCSCQEAAERMSMPLGTVTKYLSRAYALLREKLTKDQEVQK